MSDYTRCRCSYVKRACWGGVWHKIIQGCESVSSVHHWLRHTMRRKASQVALMVTSLSPCVANVLLVKLVHVRMWAYVLGHAVFFPRAFRRMEEGEPTGTSASAAACQNAPRSSDV